MPKKTKFPKKFRQTLEKVAAGREARETAPKADRNPIFDTLYHAGLLPHKSVHLMHSRLEESPFGARLVTRYVLFEDTDVHDLVRVPPPWKEP